jgi:hypothetical protein
MKHHGNEIFANAIRGNLQRYVEAPKKIDKSVIVASIGSSLRETGARFVKQDKKSKRYCELSDDQTHAKIGHAIRDVLKALDSSNPKKTDCRGPLPKCVFSHDEKPGTISQKEPAVPRPALYESLFLLNENACTKATISQKESAILLQPTSTPSTASILANPFDSFEKEQDVDMPLALCSETTFDLQDINRVHEIFSQDVDS